MEQDLGLFSVDHQPSSHIVHPSNTRTPSSSCYPHGDRPAAPDSNWGLRDAVIREIKRRVDKNQKHVCNTTSTLKEGVFSCPYCLKEFSTKDCRDRHIDTFDPRKLYLCAISSKCQGKLFTRKTDFVTHLRDIMSDGDSLVRAEHSLSEEEVKRKTEMALVWDGTATRYCRFCNTVLNGKSQKSWRSFYDVRHVASE